MEFFTTTVPIVTYDVLENIDSYNEFLLYLTRSKPMESQSSRRLAENDEYNEIL